MIGTDYFSVIAKIQAYTIGTDGLTANSKEYDHSRSTMQYVDSAIRKVVLAPGANITLDLPSEPCYVMLRAHRHETDPDDEDLAITDPMEVQLTGAIAGVCSELIVRIEDGAVQGITVTAPADAGDSVTIELAAFEVYEDED